MGSEIANTKPKMKARIAAASPARAARRLSLLKAADRQSLGSGGAAISGGGDVFLPSFASLSPPLSFPLYAASP